MEKKEMGEACRAYRREERCIQGFGGDIRKKDHVQNQGVDGRILKWIFKKWDGAQTGLIQQEKFTLVSQKSSLGFQILYVAHAPLCSLAWLL
jgi:hypothetical protein